MRRRPAAGLTTTTAGDAALRVAFSASPNAGGAPVTKYLVEWDLMGAEAVLAGGAVAPVLYAPATVLAVTVAAPAPGVAGAFSLSLGGFQTPPLAVGAPLAGAALPGLLRPGR
jgi:hypothetical protein